MKFLKRSLRVLVLLPLRAYFRYSPLRLGKVQIWKYLAAHLWWLESRANARTEFGSRLLVDASDMCGRFICYFGIWEPILTSWIKTRLSPGDCFVDIGANVGYYSLLASRLVGPDGRVVSLEAAPRTFALLQHNLNANLAQNVRPVNMAVWDKAGVLDLYTAPESITGTSSLMSRWVERWGLSERCSVATAPLSSLLEAGEVKTVRLIKIDVEGAELEVIQGLLPVLGSTRDDLEIIVEIAIEHLESVCSSFRELGFVPYRIENEYSVRSYIYGGVNQRLSRIDSCIQGVDQVDVVFSRTNAAWL